MKVSDILLESIIGDPIRAFERFLSELGELETSGGFGIERKEDGVEVFSKLLKGFLGGSNSGIGYFIVLHFREGYPSSFAHPVECESGLLFISDIDGHVNEEVCADDFHPAHGIGRFSREVSWEGRFEFWGGSGHGCG